MTRRCEIKGCDKMHSARGLCHMHYQRLNRHGDPHFVKQKRVKKGTWANVDCLAPGCSRPAKLHGVCSLHDNRDRRLALKGIPKKYGVQGNE